MNEKKQNQQIEKWKILKFMKSKKKSQKWHFIADRTAIVTVDIENIYEFNFKFNQDYSRF